MMPRYAGPVLRDDLARLHELAAHCERRASEARHADDRIAWLALARDWLALAQPNSLTDCTLSDSRAASDLLQR